MDNVTTPQASRLYSLDILRGFFIFLALWQHYSYFYNEWFKYYFLEPQSVIHITIYQIYASLINQALPCDKLSEWASYYLTPWVSQIYLFLAAFNLAKRPQTDFRPLYMKKIKIFGIIFLFFTIENFIVSPNFGLSISIYPIQTWMFILSLLATFYYFLGTKGIIFLGVFSLIRFLLPEEDNPFFKMLHDHIHPHFEFDSSPTYFLTSGVLGFLMGRAYFNSSQQKSSQNIRLCMFIVAGLILSLIYYFYGIPNMVNTENVLEHEHWLISDFLGSFYLWGIQMIIIGVFLLLESFGFIPRHKILTYMGVYSLTIFAFHRIFFIHFWMPIRVFLGAFWGHLPENTILELWPAVILCVLIVYLIQKTKILQIVFKY